MDLNSINKTNKTQQNDNISFQGSKSVKNSTGQQVFRVFPPHGIEIGPDEELGIEIVPMKDAIVESQNYHRDFLGSVPDTEYAEMVDVDDEFRQGKKTYFDIDLFDHGIYEDGQFAYRYVVYNKKDNKPATYIDSNNVEREKTYTDSAGAIVEADGKKYTLASNIMGTSRNEGPMEHIFTDSYNVLQTYHNKIKKQNPDDTRPIEDVYDSYRRNHLNRAGGTINGIREKLDNELSSNKLIMTTPLIGGGRISSHMYHPSNHFQISNGTGTKKDFLDLQKDCFNLGKGYVLDGAFTSQGYEGVQFNHAVHNPDSPFKYWFKSPSEEGFQIGVFPNKDTEHIGIRVVNPYNVEGYTYNPDMPTYIQFYDTRLASKEQLEERGKLIVQYDNDMPDDPYDITMWDDGTLNNYFEVDPKSDVIKNFDHQDYNQWAKGKDAKALTDLLGTKISFVRRAESGGYAGWDGNIDLVKMNLSDHTKEDKMREGNVQARNYIYNIASYWTKETRNALVLDVAQKLHEKNKGQASETLETRKYLSDLENKFELKKETLSNIYDDAKSGNLDYNLRITDTNMSDNDLIQDRILSFPLESLSYSPELLGVLSTPYITPRPTKDMDPNASKLEILENSSKCINGSLNPKMKKVYTEKLPTFIKGIMNDIQDPKAPLIKQNGDSAELTEYGKYFLEIATDDIMEFAITESLFDKTEAFDKNGNLDYEGSDLRPEINTPGNGKRFNINKLHILRRNSDKEADDVVSKLSSGLDSLKTKKPEQMNNFKTYLKNTYLGASLSDYKAAEAILDQTGGGLNWRFDAAKDVSDFNEARENLNAETVWNDVIDFWKPFVKNVRDVNPSSYVVAEVTTLWSIGDRDYGKYLDGDMAEGIFFKETGATTTSNYSTFFGLYPKTFGKNIEEGAIEWSGDISHFLSKVEGFVHPESKWGPVVPENIIGSHVFLDNHDKPRAAHLMAVDAGLFWGNFEFGNDAKEVQNKKAMVLDVLGRKEFDPATMSSKATAVAQMYEKYFAEHAKKLGFSDDEVKILDKSIKHLANGYKFKSDTDKTPDFKRAEAFGAAPFEVTIPNVIEQAQAMGLNTEGREVNVRELKDSVHHSMVEPYLTKMTSIYEMMSGAVGIPTLFAGSEFAQTGAEARSKNVYLGCRNLIRHDWIDEHKKGGIAEFNSRIKQIGALSKLDKGMSALSGGTPVVAPAINADKASKPIMMKAIGEIEMKDLKPIFAFMKDDPTIKPILMVPTNNKYNLANALELLDLDTIKTAAPYAIKDFKENYKDEQIEQAKKQKATVPEREDIVAPEPSKEEIIRTVRNYKDNVSLQAKVEGAYKNALKAKVKNTTPEEYNEFRAHVAEAVRNAHNWGLANHINEKLTPYVSQEQMNAGIDEMTMDEVNLVFDYMKDDDDVKPFLELEFISNGDDLAEALKDKDLKTVQTVCSFVGKLDDLKIDEKTTPKAEVEARKKEQIFEAVRKITDTDEISDKIDQAHKKAIQDKIMATKDNADEFKQIQYKTMDEMKKIVDKSKVRALNTKLHLVNHEVGAIYKYNDKGSGVLSVMTNVFIPSAHEIRGLKTPQEIGDGFLPKLSDLVLKDTENNLLVKPGTEFTKVVYDEGQGKYVKSGTYKTDKNGKLFNVSGQDDNLNSTVTFFEKVSNNKNLFYSQQAKQ